MINNKPVFLWPFILVYRIVTLVIKFPILFVRYFCLGIFYTVSFIIRQILGIFKYGFLGFIYICYIVYIIVRTILRLVKYFILGLCFPFIAAYKTYNDEVVQEKRNALKEQKKKEKEEQIKKQELKLKTEQAEKEKIKQQRLEQKALAEKKKQEILVIKQQEKAQKPMSKAKQERLNKQAEIKKQKEEALALKKEAEQKKKQERLDKQVEIKKQKEEALALKKEAEQKKKQERLDKQAEIKKQKEEALALKKEAKEKKKQERLDRQAEAKRKREEKRSYKLNKPKITRTEKRKFKLEREKARKEEQLLEKQQEQSVNTHELEPEFAIHAPQNDILNEEKQAEFNENKVLTKEERRQLKLEKQEKRKAEKEARRLEKLNQPKLTQSEKRKLKLEKAKAKKEERLRLAEEKKKEKAKLKEVYINENVQIEKLTLSQKLSNSLKELNKLPDKLIASVKKSWNNSTFVKNSRNKKDMDRQALLINFEGEDAIKSDKKVVYEYVGKNPEGKLIKGYFEAFSKVEVHSFLLSEGFEVYSIRTSRLIQLLHGTSGTNKTKFKIKDLIFFLTQLSTYIKAGIPLVDSLKILSRQYKNKSYERIFRGIIYDLTMGENFSEALSKQGNAFPRLLINMIKASEMTGELPEALDDMADYYTETDKTRKQMITAMMYPSIIFIIAIAAVTFIMVYVVPQFVAIYDSMDNARLPWITQFVVNLSDFLQSNLVMILVVVVIVIIILVYLYKKVKLFRTIVQYLVMHLPVFGNVIIYNEVTMFTKTFCSLLKHNVFITDSMEILNKITSNEIYKMIILDTITNLARGEKISLAFKDHWAVPLPAYEMIVTGERTGQLPEMMGKVSAYYQEMHRNATTRIKTFIEPMLILFLTVVVGGIVLSIIIPMFDMYNNMGL